MKNKKEFKKNIQGLPLDRQLKFLEKLVGEEKDEEILKQILFEIERIKYLIYLKQESPWKMEAQDLDFKNTMELEKNILESKEIEEGKELIDVVKKENPKTEESKTEPDGFDSVAGYENHKKDYDKYSYKSEKQIGKPKLKRE